MESVPADATDKSHAKFEILIDRSRFRVHSETMTGAELRALPPVPEDRDLYLDKVGHGDDELIEPDTVVHIKDGLHFHTVPRHLNAGSPVLPAFDEQHLRATGLTFETSRDADGAVLVICDYQLPLGFTRESTDLLIRIPPGYPDAGLDMFWVRPEIRLASTNEFPNAANVFETVAGGSAQRFSRHGFPWRAGEDGIASYLGWIRRCLTVDVTPGVAA